MTLVWKDCSDGQWRAPAVSFRDGARWIEVGGTYVIEQLGGSAFTADYRDEGRRFSVTYQNGGSITVLGICRTIGGAHVLTEAHITDVYAQPAGNIPATSSACRARRRTACDGSTCRSKSAEGGGKKQTITADHRRQNF